MKNKCFKNLITLQVVFFFEAKNNAVNKTLNLKYNTSDNIYNSYIVLINRLAWRILLFCKNFK